METLKEPHKSVNYQEMSHVLDVNKAQETVAVKINKSDMASQVSHTTHPQYSKNAYLNEPPRIPLDEALQLHKSKSYIVNLIDRALSKELGTLPEVRYKELVRKLNTKKKVFTELQF